MNVVLDASVTVKWVLNDPEREPDTDVAMAVMRSVVSRNVTALQPAHWLIEVAGVLAREEPDTALERVRSVQAMRLRVTDGPEFLRRACEMAIETGQHVFDTLYHAIALETPDTVLITADEAYMRKSKHYGHIQLLRDRHIY
jgi:predicted nucleic acid-binding protein